MDILEKKYHHVDVYVGSRLRERRLELNLSQEELARGVHITFQQIQKYEKGHNRISSSMLYDLSVVLEIQVGYFFQGLDKSTKRKLDAKSKNRNNSGNKMESLLKSPEIQELVMNFKSITNKKLKNQVLLFVKILSQK
jgi:transcriptional regulator with XRE-family HTH domain